MHGFILLKIRERKEIILVDLDDSIAVYDTFLEILPSRINRLLPKLSQFQLTVDLYGKKNKENIDSDFILTSKKIKDPIAQFGRKMTPQELNVAYEIGGDAFSLGKVEKLTRKRLSIRQNILNAIYDTKGNSVLKIVIGDIVWAFQTLVSRIKH